MSRISDIYNQHEHADFAVSGIRTTPFQGLSARTRELCETCNESARYQIDTSKGFLCLCSLIAEVELRELDRIIDIIENDTDIEVSSQRMVFSQSGNWVTPETLVKVIKEEKK